MLAILEKPVLSEKSMKLVKSGFYTFVVNKSADKPSITEAIQNQFKVDVTAIKVMNFKSKKKLQRNRRGYYQTSGYKKAIVRLKKGQRIDGFIPDETKEVEVKTADTKEVKPQIKEKRSLRGTKVKVEKVTESKESTNVKTDQAKKGDK